MVSAGHKMAILKRSVRAMCGVKLIEKRSSQELKGLLGLEETLNKMQWCGHVLRRDNDDMLRRVLDFEVAGRRGHGQSKMMWRRQVV